MTWLPASLASYILSLDNVPIFLQQYTTSLTTASIPSVDTG